MPTENPKISAYVPRVVYERFIQFKEERKVTFSQAAIEIFAEYFDIDLNKSTINTSGGLPSRFSKLEEEVENLKGIINELSKKVNQGSILSKPLVVDQGVPLSIPLKEQALESALPLDNSLGKTSEPGNTESELLSGLPINTEDLGAKDWLSGVELSPEDFESGSIQGELKSKPLVKNEEPALFEDISFKLDGNVIYLDTSAMALRLGVSEPTLRARKSQLKGEDFIDWLLKHDPDKVRWVFVKQGRKVQYVTPSDLSQDVKDKIVESLSNPKPSKRRSKAHSELDRELHKNE